MRHTFALLALACTVGLATPTIFAGPVLANYRGVTLGDSIEVVVKELKLSDGERLHAAEGPARDLARRTAEAAAIRARDEKIRRENKTNFKPN